MTYELIDSGEGEKLERFGPYTLVRPCPQALWKKGSPSEWKGADGMFTREKRWKFAEKLPKEWSCSVGGVSFKISPTDFGHLGVFPEHAKLWEDLRSLCRKRPLNILNLFAYSGGATLAFAQEGAKVCHLDASKGMVEWARENASLNRLEKAPIRWIIDDALKFLTREVKRGVRYDGILLDPPSFGRGSRGEVFKIEDDLPKLLELCRSLLSEDAQFLVLSCHTPGVTPIALHNIAYQFFPKARLETGEMVLTGPSSLPIPSGSYVKAML